MDIANIRFGTASLFKSRFKILGYHDVDDHEEDIFTLPVQNFKDQMYYLKGQGYQVIPLEKAYRQIITRSIDNNSIVLTFDDGAESLQKNVFPILRELGFPATVFIPLGYLGKECFFSEKDVQQSRVVIGWDVIEKSLDQGISYGSHTMTHPSLLGLTSDEANYEIVESYNELKKRLQLSFIPFAYPYGHYNRHIQKLIAVQGYQCALLYDNVLSNTDTVDLFGLKRESIECSTTLEQFSHKININNDLKRGIDELFSDK
jgi:peptidoglycan/xylan/chitin deacetylase (PgdA/CDA1 family)